IDGAVHAGLGRLHRIVLVMDRGSRTGQIVDLIHLHIERECHVVAHELKVGLAEQMLDIALAAGEEVVHTNDLVAGLQKPIAQVGAKKAGSARDENGFSLDHAAALARGSAIRETLASEEARVLCNPGWLMSALCNEAPLSAIEPMFAKIGSMTSEYDIDG